MTTKTAIQWADFSLNPGIYGCSEISRACSHCYAAIMAHRQVAMGNYPPGITKLTSSGVHWTGLVITKAEHIAPAFEKLPKRPHADGRPRRVFVTSMADVFHADVSFEHVDLVFEHMAARPHLIFMLLTKRSERAKLYAHHRRRLAREWPGNVWLGVTVEAQREAWRIIDILDVHEAPVLFVSAEPLVVGPLDLKDVVSQDGSIHVNALTGHWRMAGEADDGQWISWVITGGESGGKAAPTHPKWFTALRDDAVRYGTHLFHKQDGEWMPRWAGITLGAKTALVRPEGGLASRDSFRPGVDVQMIKVGMGAARATLDGVEWSQVPPWVYDEQGVARAA